MGKKQLNLTPVINGETLTDRERYNYKHTFSQWLKDNAPKFKQYYLYSYCYNCKQDFYVKYDKNNLGRIFLTTKDKTRLCSIPVDSVGYYCILCTCGELQLINYISSFCLETRYKLIKNSLQTSSDKLFINIGRTSSGSISNSSSNSSLNSLS